MRKHWKRSAIGGFTLVTSSLFLNWSHADSPRIAAGNGHSLVVKADGTLWSWGFNRAGELGTGIPPDPRATSPNVLAQVGKDTNWIAVSGRWNHTVAVKADGSLWSWGLNLYGQLGDGTYIDRWSPTRIGTDQNWKTGSAGQYHTLALKKDGSLWAWGRPLYNVVASPGNRGLPATNNTSSDILWRNFPTQIPKSGVWTGIIAGSDQQDAAIQSDGSLWAWGRAEDGRLHGGWLRRGYSQLVFSGFLDNFSILSTNIPVQANPSRTWTMAAIPLRASLRLGTNRSSSMVALSDGTLWGDSVNVATNLVVIDAEGHREIRSDVFGTNSPSGFGSGWASISAGYSHVAGIKQEGSLWSWGENDFGQLGDGTGGLGSFKDVPVRIGNDTEWVAVAAGEKHTLGLKADGSLWGWGDIQLNIGSLPRLTNRITSLIPVPLMSIGIPIPEISTVSGRVLDRQTGKPIPGAQVSVGPVPATSDAQGKYKARIEPGEYIASASKGGYMTSVRSVGVPRNASVSRNFVLSLEARSDPGGGGGGTPPPTELISVDSITTDFPGYLHFLDGIRLPLKFVASVNWAGHPPGKIKFITPRKTEEVSVTGNSAEILFDVGTEFGPGGRLKVQAVSSDGSVSPEKTADFAVMPSPIAKVPFALSVEGAGFRYTNSAAFQLGLFDGQGVQAGKVRSDVPFFGNLPATLTLNPFANASISSSGQARLALSAPQVGGVNVAGFNAVFEESLSGERQFPGGAAWGPWSDFNVGMRGNFTPPPLTFQIVAPVIPIPVYVKISGGISGDFTTQVIDLEPQLRLNNALTVQPTLRGEIGAGLADMAAVDAWIQGTATMKFSAPPPELQSMTVDVTGGVGYVLLTFRGEAGIVGPWTWSYPEARASSLGLQSLVTTQPIELKPQDRSYLTQPDYAQFWGQHRALSRANALASDITASTTSTPLQTQVYPYSQANVSAAGTNAYLVWLYDDPKRGSLNRTVALFSSYDGANWRSPVPIHDDATADFHPRVAAFADGSAVAVWENERIVVPDNSDVELMKANLEIAASVFDPAVRAWTAPQMLSTNRHLDRSPKIAGVSKDSALAIWIANESNDVMGSSAKTNTLWWSRRQGVSWTPAQRGLEIPYAVLKFDLYFEGGLARVIFSLDTDHDPQTINDHELFVTAFRDGVWFPLTRLSNDQVADENPQWAKNRQNRSVPTLVWLRGTELSSTDQYSVNVNTRSVIRTNDYTSNLAEFRLASNDEGLTALTWAESSNSSSDLWTQIYDATSGWWGAPKRLTSDNETELGITAALYRTNTLMAVYNRTQPRFAGTTRVSALGVGAQPFPLSTDLNVLQYRVGDDLALVNGTFSSSVANPAPSSATTLQVTVENRGDKAADDVSVAFYQGDPSQGGVLLGQQFLSPTLKPGERRSVPFNWSVPTSASEVSVYAVVDPARLRADSDRSNNTASLALVRPDLSIADFYWEKLTRTTVSVTVRVANQGVIQNTPTAVKIFRGNPRGAVLASEPVEALPPGGSTEVSFLIEVSDPREDFEVSAALEVANDFDTSNNVADVFVSQSAITPLLRLGALTFSPTVGARFSVQGEPGRLYRLETSPDLRAWSRLIEFIALENSVTLTDEAAKNSSQRFYRISEP